MSFSNSAQCWLILAFGLSACSQAPDLQVAYVDLVEREGRYYQKFSDDPFTGLAVGSMAGEIRNGLWHGKVLTFNSGGQLLVRESFREGILNGNSTWFRDGEPWQQVGYQDGLLHGEFYSTPQGGESVKGSFQFGALDGSLEVLWPYDDGLKYKANYARGLISDDSVTFFARYSGAKTLSVTLVDGVQNGIAESYFTEGELNAEQVEYQATWLNGELESCTQYDSEGRLKETITFSAASKAESSGKNPYETFIDTLKVKEVNRIKYALCSLTTSLRASHTSWTPKEHKRARAGTLVQ